jgi:ATP-dependent exoDNAse (exonuclease V) beta subunit
MKKLGRDNLECIAALDAVDEWEQKELKRARAVAKSLIHDQAEIMRIMIEKTTDLGEAKAYLQHLLQRDGRIYLMTGHKAKGLEFDRVWFLDQHLCQVKHDQDANIKYVVETRAKNYLAYVTSDTFEEAEEA